MTKRIAITGASGFIGQQLVPLLEAEGHELVLIGRDANKLANIFHGRFIADYSNLADAVKGAHSVLHLAVLNNNEAASPADFEAINVGLLSKVLQASQTAKVQKFIYTTSTQVGQQTSPYAQSKAKAEQLLAKVEGLDVVILRLPIVYGQKFAGKLARLNSSPGFLAAVLFSILASLKPTLHISKLATGINTAFDAESSCEILLTDSQHNNWFYQLAKRAVGIGFALGILIVFWWLLLGVWVAVRLTSDGPGIFAQKRVGQFDTLFTLYKFRTMAKDTKQAGSHEVSSASLTKIGSFLRKTKIDELPQIFNILRGEISLIGPRPCLPVQEELVAARKARNVLDILPGITGYAQVQGIDMSDPQLLAKTDEEYLKLRTLPLDFKILIATFLGRGNGDRIKG